MSILWRIGVMSVLFLFAAIVSILFVNLLLFGIFVALFVISLAGAFFATLFNKSNKASGSANDRQVKARQAAGYTQERIRQRAEEDRGKRQRGG